MLKSSTTTSPVSIFTLVFATLVHRIRHGSPLATIFGNLTHSYAANHHPSTLESVEIIAHHLLDNVDLGHTSSLFSLKQIINKAGELRKPQKF